MRQKQPRLPYVGHVQRALLVPSTIITWGGATVQRKRVGLRRARVANSDARDDNRVVVELELSGAHAHARGEHGHMGTTTTHGTTATHTPRPARASGWSWIGTVPRGHRCARCSSAWSTCRRRRAVRAGSTPRAPPAATPTSPALAAVRCRRRCPCRRCRRQPWGEAAASSRLPAPAHRVCHPHRPRVQLLAQAQALGVWHAAEAHRVAAGRWAVHEPVVVACSEGHELVAVAC